MRQLWIYILYVLVSSIGSMIDNAFGNNMGIDSICILSAFTVITWIVYRTVGIGNYAFRVLQKNDKNCLFVTVSVSVVLGIFCYFTSGLIPKLYSLTDPQYRLFEKCLKVYAFYIPVYSAGEFMSSYLVFKCKNRLLFFAEVLYWILMIGLDAAVFIKGWELHMLYAATGVTYAVYTAITISLSGILKIKDPLSIKHICRILKYGGDMSLDRIASGIGVIIYNSFASRLGTMEFAVHSIANGAIILGENIPNAVYRFCCLELKKTAKARFACMKEIVKKSYWRVQGITILFCLAAVIVTHGETSFRTSIMMTSLYGIEFLIIPWYEGIRGYVTAMENTDILKKSGFLSLVIKSSCVLTGYYAGLGLVTFIFTPSVDFILRGMYIYHLQKKREKSS